MPAKPSEHDKAAEQREAAAAVQLLAERLGPDFPRFVDLFEAASFRFRVALMRHLEDTKRCGRLPEVGSP